MDYCVSCNSPAKMMCCRCFEPYCGIACQRNDWRRHKGVCKPIPDLISVDLLDTFVDEAMQKVTISSGPKKVEMPTPDASEDLESKKFVQAPKTVVSGENPNEMVSVKPSVSPVKEGIIKTPSSGTKNDKPTESSKTIRPTGLRALKSMSMPEAVKQSPKMSRFYFKDVKTIPIREGNNVSLLVTDTSFIKDCFIAAMDNENKSRHEMAKNLQKLEEYCKNAEKSKKGYDPQNKEMCLAIFDEDGNWYRAIATDKKENGIYSVQFLDYGNVATVNRANIMPITEEHIFPTCTNLCNIVNLKQSHLPKLKKYIDENGIIKCNVQYSNELETYEVSIPNADELLN